MATTELVFRIKTDSSDFKSTMAQVRSELTQTGKTQSTVGKGELSMRQQLSAASSLQRQRSASLIGEWKKTETAAKQLATGIQPVSTNIQKITDTMQTLARSTATIQGPLGGVAGRLSSIGSIAGETGGSLGLIGVAIGAVSVAVTALGVAFVKLTLSTAEFQGKFADLSQQVGVTVETLSTLNILASTTGGSIDTVTGSLALFQRNLEEAHDPTSKEAKLLKELGVTSFETEAALRQTLKGLFNLGVGAKQTDASLQLFGRSGRFVNAILKESHGNLDEATEKFARMGLIVSTEAAIAADKFNDTLIILGEQLAAVGRQLVTQTIPVFIAFFEDISRALTGNANDWEDWARAIEVWVAAALGALQGFVTWVASRFTVDLSSAIDQSIKGLLDRAQNIRAVIGVIATTTRAARLAGTGVRRTGGGGKGRAPRDTGLRDATREAGLAEREALLITAEDITENKRAFEEQARSIEDFTRRAIEFNEDQLNATIDRITAESNALDDALAKRLIKRDEYETKQRELDLQAAKANQESKEFEFKAEQERDKKISEARIAAKKREVDIAEALDAQEIKRIDQRVEDYLLSVSEGEKQVGAILDAGFQRRRELLVEEEDAYSTSLQRRADITAEIIKLDNQRVFSAEEAARRIAKAAFDEQNRGAAGATRDRTVGGSPDLFRELGQVMSETFGTGAAQAEAFGSIISSTFSQIGSAVGEAVKAFVLFGTVGGSFKKFAAEVIASIAQMAAVQAVFELAQGLAMLALAYFFPNVAYFKSSATHFAAAAMFGGIAVGAALAGRAVAGNSFATAGSGGGGVGERTGGPDARREAPEVRDINRRGGLATPTINLRVNVTRDEGSTVKAVVDNYRSNGIVRNLILNEG